MGLPTEQDWPSQSPIPRSSFINNDLKLQKKEIEAVIPNIDKCGKDLLLHLLDFNLKNRISGRDSLLHDFFKQEVIKVNDKGALLDSASLPDITNTFQPNILKRKRNSQTNNQQQVNQTNENG